MLCGSDLTQPPKLKLILNQASNTMQCCVMKYFSFVVDTVSMKEEIHSITFFIEILMCKKFKKRLWFKIVFQLASLLYIHNFGYSNQLAYI